MKFTALMCASLLLLAPEPPPGQVFWPAPIKKFFTDISEVMSGDDSEPQDPVEQPVPEKKPIKILFEGPITEEGVDRLIGELEQVKSLATKLEITIDTPGGDFDATQKFAKWLERSGLTVECTVDGMAASGGSYLLQSCTTRAMTKRSALMFHAPWYQNVRVGDRKNLTDLLRQIDVGENQYAEQCVARMKISAKEFKRRIYMKDWWLTPEEALEVGAVDRVVDSPNRRLADPPSGCQPDRQSCP
jgi:ATP-dependent protease ClpP protease subunit